MEIMISDEKCILKGKLYVELKENVITSGTARIKSFLAYRGNTWNETIRKLSGFVALNCRSGRGSIIILICRYAALCKGAATRQRRLLLEGTSHRKQVPTELNVGF